MKPFLLLMLVVCVQRSAGQWDFSPDQLEIFDLVDETKTNFYNFLGVAQDASQLEIRRSYRKLSLTMHPDRNKTEGAEENFRILAAMYEILKTKEKREIYDNVLYSGLPAAYLYVPKQLRKMGLLEVSIIVSLILTLGHYLIMWGSYIERKLELDEILPRRRKKQKKQRRKGEDDGSQEPEEEFLIPKPSLYDVLPVLVTRKFYAFVIWLPEYIKHQQELKKILKEEEEAELQAQEEAELEYQEQLARKNEAKRLKQERNRQRREEALQAQQMAAKSGPLPPSVFEDSKSIEELEAMYDEMGEDEFKKKKPKKEEWTEEDQTQLVKLMTKYPGGTPERWTKISKEMGRTMMEVTTKAKNARSGVGTKAKYSAVTTSTTPLFTKNRNVGTNKIPDDIISTPLDRDNERREYQIKKSIGNLLAYLQSSAVVVSSYELCGKLVACMCVKLKLLLAKMLPPQQDGQDEGESESDRKQEETNNSAAAPSSPTSKLKQKQEARNIKNAMGKPSNSDPGESDLKNTDTNKWEQNQQKSLEMALAQFPKSSGDRWEKISRCVPGKSKEECIARYKFVAEMVQQRKKHRT